ncbi:zinc finger, RING/FYVE/PHD-type containing protein, partial [Tanacetum coccineum]
MLDSSHEGDKSDTWMCIIDSWNKEIFVRVNNMDEMDYKSMDIIKVNSDDDESSEEEEEEEECLECEGEEFIELEEEDFKELGELKEPVVTSWKGENGETIHGIMVINDELTDPKNKCHLDVCPICLLSLFHYCLPCGHMYGLSCIKKRLLQSSSWGKCPQCNTFCSYTNVILLYASRICASPHQRTSSSRHFPFTEEGFIEYKLNERCRHRDAKKV